MFGSQSLKFLSFSLNYSGSPLVYAWRFDSSDFRYLNDYFETHTLTNLYDYDELKLAIF